MTRTSITDPLYIDEVSCAGGVIGMTICPGKRGLSLSGTDWARDVYADLAVIADWRPDAVVTLMEPRELADVGVSDLGDRIEAAGIEWWHLPIRDGGAPDATFERLWVFEGQALRARLQAGGRILIHCRGGLGRTGLLAAKLLIEFGENPEDAIGKVRQARFGAIETRSQETYVRCCRPLETDEVSCGFMRYAYGRRPDARVRSGVW